MKIRFIIILIISTSFSYGQNITLEIEKILTKTENELLLNCKVLNNDTLEIKILKFDPSDFCDGLAYLSIDSPIKKGSYYPCDGPKQLSNIFLNDNNTVNLKQGNYYKFSILVKLRSVSFKLLTCRSYDFQLLLNFNNIVSENDMQICKQPLISNKYKFLIEH